MRHRLVVSAVAALLAGGVLLAAPAPAEAARADGYRLRSDEQVLRICRRQVNRNARRSRGTTRFVLLNACFMRGGVY
jgi:hypothetical protein